MISIWSPCKVCCVSFSSSVRVSASFAPGCGRRRHHPSTVSPRSSFNRETHIVAEFPAACTKNV
eukprot:2565600-Amphidinium_carterae.1